MWHDSPQWLGPPAREFSLGVRGYRKRPTVLYDPLPSSSPSRKSDNLPRGFLPPAADPEDCTDACDCRLSLSLGSLISMLSVL